jgi:glycosyltransferase involved in cell wall biosynthesis
MPGHRTAARIGIVGTVGIPANYGGFETLVENLTAHAQREGLLCDVEVHCTSVAYPERHARHNGARLLYLPIPANGVWSIPYDVASLVRAAWRRNDAILVLGVSGAIALPLLRLVSRARLVVNIDGLEWKRAKWSRPAAAFLRWCERIAVRSAHVVVADNQGIVNHVRKAYGRDAVDIAYGGDHAVLPGPPPPAASAADGAALMLCRIEPENNVAMILNAYTQMPANRLVAVGNWDNSEFGRALKARYAGTPNLELLDPVYEPEALNRLRSACAVYVHGHSAGGTNPSLVEMMSLGKPVIAFDCTYNRYTTEGRASFFSDVETLKDRIAAPVLATDGEAMKEIAARRYTWAEVGRRYFDLLLAR